MLGRVFDEQCIYLNPIRDDTGKELTDVLIAADDAMLFIQAKGSLNSEAALRRTVERKRAATRAHVHKAARQLRGAMSYGATTKTLATRTTDGPAILPTGDRLFWGLVVVREMFDDNYAACSASVLGLVESLGFPAILLDYSSLHVLVQNLLTPARFTKGLGTMFETAIQNQRFPKPVFLGPARQD